jgi:hypothetical protein
MSDDAHLPLPPEAAQALIGSLEEAGFFGQIRDLERTLKQIAGDLKLLGDATVRGLGETESLVAHILALEAAVAVLMRATPHDIDALRADIRAEIRQRAAGISADSAPKVEAAAEALLSRAKRGEEGAGPA